ncbi:MAG: hypothetical protein ACRERV_16710, partial [Methylococcales bacterium]
MISSGTVSRTNRRKKSLPAELCCSAKSELSVQAFSKKKRRDKRRFVFQKQSGFHLLTNSTR